MTWGFVLKTQRVHVPTCINVSYYDEKNEHVFCWNFVISQVLVIFQVNIMILMHNINKYNLFIMEGFEPTLTGVV
jgi:hypothetical protein